MWLQRAYGYRSGTPFFARRNKRQRWSNPYNVPRQGDGNVLPGKSVPFASRVMDAANVDAAATESFRGFDTPIIITRKKRGHEWSAERSASERNISAVSNHGNGQGMDLRSLVLQSQLSKNKTLWPVPRHVSQTCAGAVSGCERYSSLPQWHRADNDWHYGGYGQGRRALPTGRSECLCIAVRQQVLRLGTERSPVLGQGR
jgi:hypothetical protein